jgi:hypothetical protein
MIAIISIDIENDAIFLSDVLSFYLIHMNEIT